MKHDDYRNWCKGRVELEELFKAQGAMLDVWPAGWTSQQIEAARALGRAALAEDGRAENGIADEPTLEGDPVEALLSTQGRA